MEPIHERIDIEGWKSEFSLAKLRALARLRVEREAEKDPKRYPSEAEIARTAEFVGTRTEMVSGPREIAVIEQLRAESTGRIDRGLAVPTDVCVWSRGEPPHPATTKIGGRPLRAPRRAWPSDPNGKPFGLLAQFCFADSLDVLPVKKSAIPGDLLLIFTSGPDMYTDWDANDKGTWAVEWYDLHRDRLELPETSACIHDVTPAFAALHRTFDYPEADFACDDGANIIYGSKFGGAAAFQQGDPGLPGQHICTLGSLNPFGTPWPLLNVPTNPNGDEQYLDRNLLMLGDEGAAYFFIDPDGRLRWTADCG